MKGLRVDAWELHRIWWRHVASMWHFVAMERIGVRELRDGLSGILRRVASGETVEVTDHGHPVARIVPLRHRSRYEQLVAEGKLTRAEEPGGLLDFEPLPLEPGERPLSEILAELRADER